MTIRFDVLVRFARRRPSAVELMAVRHYIPGLSDKTIGEVRTFLEREAKDNWTCLFIGFTQEDAQRIVAGLRARGVDAAVE